MRKVAIYPGTFDPVTYGHIDLIKRAVKIFDTVIVAVARDSGKRTLFSISERVELLKESIKGMENVKVEKFEGLVVKYAKKRGARVMIRGLRMLSDFEYEFQMALTNRRLAGDIETIFMMPHQDFSYLSSNLIKEAASLGASVKDFVPSSVERRLRRKLKKVRR
ncbi:MAG: pantetheine-phosphate adenylyltransferase [Candidatus Omnitrophica bacterium CG1_02_49_10]|nr:MAG: pantetheine-phosphate adenylyltransferase [Candidatus Omnitrophica bacterium CG1_02_49_10]